MAHLIGVGLRYRHVVAKRRMTRLELLAVGTELTSGATRDSNGGDLAREATRLGLAVTRLVVLPDELEAVREAFMAGLQRADLVVSTGGLGPTPDDLTREAIGGAIDEAPVVDPVLERWLETLFSRRGLPMVEANRKQAWLLPSARALLNPHGTAPGWWVDRPDGRVIVALPGPPREMWPMWRTEVLPRLLERGVGRRVASQTLRLTGIGESGLVELIGDERLRSTNPSLATYAGPDAVDLRVTAAAEGDDDPDGAQRLLEATLVALGPLVGRYVFAKGEESWLDALGDRLAGRTVAALEAGSGGSLAGLIGAAPWFLRGEVVGDLPDEAPLERLAEEIRRRSGADIGLAVSMAERGGDTQVAIGIDREGRTRCLERVAFLGGEQGRRRGAVTTCAALWSELAKGRADA